MKRTRFVVCGLLLAGGVTAAVSSLVAQAPQPIPKPEPRSERRVFTLDGRGGQLGVSVRDLDAEGLKAAAGALSGVRIDAVNESSPAEKAGLREGDIVVELDGDRVRSARQFARLIQETPDGRSVRLAIVRGGQRQTVDVTPETRAFGWGFDGDLIGREIERGWREMEPRFREIEPRLRELEPRLRELEPRLREFRFDGPLNFDFEMLPRMTNPRGRLGVQLESLTTQLGEYFGAKDGGVLISSVTGGSAAEKAGLKAGDVITSVNGDRVRDYDDLLDQLRTVSGEVTIGVIRDKKEQTIKATIEPASAHRWFYQPA